MPPGPAALPKPAPTALTPPVAVNSESFAQAQTKSAAGGPMGFLQLARAQQNVPVLQKAGHSGLGFGDDGFGLDDVLDAINPLQHLPIVSTLYRAITGDHIDTVPNMVGGAIYGGVLGFAMAAVDSAIEDATGKDVGAQVMAALIGEPGDSKTDSTQVAAATTPDAAGGAAAPEVEPAPSTPHSDGPTPWYLAAAGEAAEPTPETAEAAEQVASIAPAAGQSPPTGGPAADGNAAAPHGAGSSRWAGSHPLTKAQLTLLAEREAPEGDAPGVPGTAGEESVSSLAASPGPVPADPQPVASADRAGVRPADGIPELTPEQFALLMKSIGAEPAAQSETGGGESVPVDAAGLASVDAGAPQSHARISPAEGPENPPENGIAPGPGPRPAPPPSALTRTRPFTMPAQTFPAGAAVRGRAGDSSFAQRMQRGLDSYMKNRVPLNPHPLTLNVVQ